MQSIFINGTNSSCKSYDSFVGNHAYTSHPYLTLPVSARDSHIQVYTSVDSTRYFLLKKKKNPILSSPIGGKLHLLLKKLEVDKSSASDTSEYVLFPYFPLQAVAPQWPWSPVFFWSRLAENKFKAELHRRFSLAEMPAPAPKS